MQRYQFAQGAYQFRKTYDEDVHDKIIDMESGELLRWYNNTGSMISRIIREPDPSKGNPDQLIAKLNARVLLMEQELIKRGVLGKENGIVADTKRALEEQRKRPHCRTCKCHEPPAKKRDTGKDKEPSPLECSEDLTPSFVICEEN